MVKNSALTLLLLCLTAAGWAAAETRLTVKVDKKNSVLGEPVLLEIRAEEVSEPLSSISLEKLKTDFNVYASSSSAQTQRRKGRSISTETMTLTLYPLHSGRLHVPALIYRGKSSKALQLSVTESGKQTQQVKIRTALDTPRPLVRQAATLTLEIVDDGSLQWSAPREIAAAGTHQLKLAESQHEEQLDGIRYTVHRYVWALMPLREGKVTVEFPMLDAFKLGTRLRYAVAPLMFDAAAAPAYLPVHVPVGKLTVEAEPVPAQIALQQPLNWRLKVQAAGLSAEGLGKLLSNLHSDSALRFYAPEIALDPNERATTAVQTWRVTIPFQPLHAGALRLPDIQLAYYDPASARVESVLLEGGRVEVVNPLWRSVWMFMLGLLVFALSLVACYWIHRQVRRTLLRRKALRAISRAAGAAELQQALLNFDCGAGREQYQTLHQWLQLMGQRHAVDAGLRAVVDKLSQARYGAQANAHVAELAREAVSLLRQARVKKNGACSGKKQFTLHAGRYSAARLRQ